MASRIRQVTLSSSAFQAVDIPIRCSEAQLRIPTDAGAAVNIREDPIDAATQDTLQPGESYRTRTTARGHCFEPGSVFIYAQAQSGTVVGIVLCYDD